MEILKSYITVSKTMSEKRSEKNMKVMTNFVAEAKKSPAVKKLWDSNFILPVQSKISSPFGAMRFVNNKVVGYHSGIDFPVPVGTPLKASNSGKVVLAKELTSTGNTLVIDHGMNVFSSYAHMSVLNVKGRYSKKRRYNWKKWKYRFYYWTSSAFYNQCWNNFCKSIPFH